MKFKQTFLKTADFIQPSSRHTIVTNKDRIFITGSSISNGVDFEGQSFQSYGNQDIFVAGLDKCGNQKFFKTAGGIDEDQGFSISSNDKMVFITGFFLSNTGIDFNGQPFQSAGSNDIFVAGLDKCGNQKFFKTAGSINND